MSNDKVFSWWDSLTTAERNLAEYGGHKASCQSLYGIPPTMPACDCGWLTVWAQLMVTCPDVLAEIVPVGPAASRT